MGELSRRVGANVLRRRSPAGSMGAGEPSLMAWWARRLSRSSDPPPSDLACHSASAGAKRVDRPEVGDLNGCDHAPSLDSVVLRSGGTGEVLVAQDGRLVRSATATAVRPTATAISIGAFGSPRP